MKASDATGVSIDINEIMARIPHRYPMLLIDRCEDFRPSQSIIGCKAVTFNEPYFQGHFPDFPVMPGVLIVEAMAQTGAVLMSKSLDIDPVGKTIMFISVDNARFRTPVRPGDFLRLEVEVLRARRDVFKFRGKATVDAKAVAEAEFAAILLETPK